jgi:hypothetical protein
MMAAQFDDLEKSAIIRDLRRVNTGQLAGRIRFSREKYC